MAEKTELLKVNLGCGTRWKSDWANLDGGPWTKLLWLRSLRVLDPILPATLRNYPRDLIAWDFRRLPLPFADNSASAVFSQYALEYLNPAEVMRCLQDCRRILAPGGVIRLCQTDIPAMIEIYLRESYVAHTPRAVRRAGEFLENVAGEHTRLFVRLFRRGGVQQLFDAPSLEWLLTEAGFTDICFHSIHEGECPDLEELEAEWRCPLIRVEARSRRRV